ncbi:MAG TPA: plastocyanin/azurin family copper-binding protein [Acidimicrobiales bacterium]|nr:plastocyanin/azurin family copper-binding protein [Acidimicrobiales bacterium]
MSRKVALLSLLGLTASGCAVGLNQPTNNFGAPSPAPGNVVLLNSSFIPHRITIKAGQTVTWHWEDHNTPHDVSFGDFGSPIQSDGTWSHTFDTPGTYNYVCGIHAPIMSGQVVVTSS